MMNHSPKARYLTAYHTRHDPEGASLLARAAWRASLLVVAVSVVGAIVWGWLELRATFAALDQEGTSLGAPVPALDRAQLRGTVSDMASQRARFIADMNVTPALSDPSR